MLKDSRVNNDVQPTRGETANDSAVTTLRQWSGLKDPRIVRVSRAFGGKDRHSKVRTVRGLRDRRVRLSVPTAIQLYDLQDRLGLNQPSKVVDWLLDAAQHEIDKLPPLQFPPENLNLFQSSNDHHFSLEMNQNQALASPSLSLFSTKANLDENLGNQCNANLSHSYSGFMSNFMSQNSQIQGNNHMINPSMLSLSRGSQLLFYPTVSQLYGGNSTGPESKEFGTFSLENFGNFHHSGSQ